MTTGVPWRNLPVRISEVLEPHLQEMIDGIIERLPHDVEAYAQPMEGAFGDAVRLGVEVALHRFLRDLPGTDLPALTEDSRRVYVSLGRAEHRRGRSLDALLSAYRSGARTVFRVAARAVADDATVPTDVIVPLGESIFAYIEELSAASVQGFADEQSAFAGERDRRRAALLHLLLAGQADEAAVGWAAVNADWLLPQSVVAVIVSAAGSTGIRSALGPDALVDLRESDTLGIIPAPTSTTARARLERALTGRDAVLGPERAWTEAQVSMRLATVAQRALPPDPNGRPIWVDEHRVEVVLAAEPDLLDDLAAERLQPLDGLSARRRGELVDTLAAWLRHRGERAPIASALGIHAQTVGYRVTQLRTLFGTVLDDPQARFELELVLRAGHR